MILTQNNKDRLTRNEKASWQSKCTFQRVESEPFIIEQRTGHCSPPHDQGVTPHDSGTSEFVGADQAVPRR